MYKVHKTRFAELGFINQEPGLWRFVDKQSPVKSSPYGFATIGPQYATKAELLADLDKFARTYGVLPPLVADPQPMEFSPYKFPRYTVLVLNSAEHFMAVAWFDIPPYAIDFCQRGGFSDWQIWENLPEQARYIDRKSEYESRLFLRETLCKS